MTKQSDEVLRGIVETFGDHSFLVGQSLEVANTLTERITQLIRVVKFGVSLSILLSGSALIVAVVS